MEGLAALMDHMGKTWNCDKERYPRVAICSKSDKEEFVVNHSLLHIVKSRGVIARTNPYGDPDPALDQGGSADQRRIAAVKLFVNGVNLAREMGLSADFIVANLAARKPHELEPLRQLDIAAGVVAAVCEQFDHKQQYGEWHQVASALGALSVIESAIEYGKYLGMTPDHLVEFAPQFVH